jgi:hypothetical protein
MIDPKPRLIAALGNVQEYLDLAISVQDRSEREFYEPIAELHLKIAQELEAMMGGWDARPAAAGAGFERLPTICPVAARFAQRLFAISSSGQVA